MKLKIFSLVCGALISSAAFAQDYGVTVGVHQTNATYSSTSATDSLAAGSTSGRLGFDLGLTASFELIPNLRFRTGALYDSRPFDYKLAGGQTVGFNLAWVDIPVNVQYNFTPMVGIYGGLIVAVKASDSMNVPSGVTYSPEVKSMVPLLNLGVNFMFNDMIGFDVYGEGGVGEFAKNAKSYQTVGMHFIYWL